VLCSHFDFCVFKRLQNTGMLSAGSFFVAALAAVAAVATAAIRHYALRAFAAPTYYIKLIGTAYYEGLEITPRVRGTRTSVHIAGVPLVSWGTEDVPETIVVRDCVVDDRVIVQLTPAVQVILPVMGSQVAHAWAREQFAMPDKPTVRRNWFLNEMVPCVVLDPRAELEAWACVLDKDQDSVQVHLAVSTAVRLLSTTAYARRCRMVHRVATAATAALVLATGVCMWYFVFVPW
jgi:hypothetical protein